MEAQKFVIERLNYLIGIFNNATFKYKFEKDSSTHIIEVQPVCTFEKNKEYIECEANFIYEFESKFFPETILFISDNSLTKIDKVDFIIKNNNYAGVIDTFLNNFNYKGYENDNIDICFSYVLAA